MDFPRMAGAGLRAKARTPEATMPTMRRTFPPEFKTGAVKLVAEQGQIFVEVTRDLDIGESMPRSWRDAIAKGGQRASPGRGNPPALQGELRRLRADVERPTMERAFLKKATAFFARESS